MKGRVRYRIFYIEIATEHLPQLTQPQSIALIPVTVQPFKK
jgi:hypothetical protein